MLKVLNFLQHLFTPHCWALRTKVSSFFIFVLLKLWEVIVSLWICHWISKGQIDLVQTILYKIISSFPWQFAMKNNLWIDFPDGLYILGNKSKFCLWSSRSLLSSNYGKIPMRVGSNRLVYNLMVNIVFCIFSMFSCCALV